MSASSKAPGSMGGTGASGTDHSVTIGVCTFRRPELFTALRSFEALKGADRHKLSVVVVDNDETDAVRASVEAFAKTYPYPLRYVHAPMMASLADASCMIRSNHSESAISSSSMNSSHGVSTASRTA
ncbi:MAG: hypothetical protein AAFN48_08235, partial [Pseudomonadota bacterium]